MGRGHIWGGHRSIYLGSWLRVSGVKLTELHPVPLTERVDIAAQVVQHPGRQLVDVASHGETAQRLSPWLRAAASLAKGGAAGGRAG